MEILSLAILFSILPRFYHALTCGAISFLSNHADAANIFENMASLYGEAETFTPEFSVLVRSAKETKLIYRVRMRS
jgi:hypothetical protein